MKKPKIPSFRIHKASKQAFVELNGHRHYLGRHDTPEARRKYAQLLAEWEANGRRLPVAPEEITIAELIDRYWEHCEQHYRFPDGTPTSSQWHIKRALRTVRELFGEMLVVDFGPLALRVVRQKLIDEGLCRRPVNHYIGLIRQMFKWGASFQIVPITVYQSLATIDGLRYGRSEAKETEPVRPVPVEHIEKVIAAVPRPIQALIMLQLYTAARPGEVVGLRAIDVDTSGPVWTAVIHKHKLSYRQTERVLYFGPKAQTILLEFMGKRPLNAPLFSPKDADAERNTLCLKRRQPNQKPTPRKTDRVIRDGYDRDSYRRVIYRTCIKLGIPVWHPHQLRHNSATEIRRGFGVEAAQVVLGHSRVDTTEIYAETNTARAIEVAAQIG